MRKVGASSAAGFDRKLWRIADIEDKAEPMVTLAHVGAHGEDGYPGRLDIRAGYRLTGRTELSVSFEAARRRPEPDVRLADPWETALLKSSLQR